MSKRAKQPHEPTDADLSGLAEADRRVSERHRVVVFQVTGGEDMLKFCVCRQRQTVVMGRDPEGALVLTDGSVSRAHCRIRHLVPSRLMIEDLGSTNGTRVNGEPVSSARPLEIGDEILVGNVPVRVDRLNLDEIAKLTDAVARLADVQTDPTTSLLPRRYLTELMPMQLETFRAARIPVALAVIDVDHFARIQAAVGPKGAAAALKVLGRIVQEAIRAQDRAVRIGADEIGIVLPNCEEAEAAALAWRLRERIAEHDWSRTLAVVGRGDAPAMDVSVGVAEHADDETIIGWIRRAGRAVRVAKELGRGRVVKASQAP